MSNLSYLEKGYKHSKFSGSAFLYLLAGFLFTIFLTWGLDSLMDRRVDEGVQSYKQLHAIVDGRYVLVTGAFEVEYLETVQDGKGFYD